MRDHVRDDVRDESLETPLNKGFLLKNVRDERVLSITCLPDLKTISPQKTPSSQNVRRGPIERSRIVTVILKTNPMES